jgi:preprotein translocase subunit SecF
LKGSSKELFPDVVNRSLNETLVRSINTSMTVIITLLAIYFLGGEAVKGFSLALLIGIAFGTYSSIFIASALLVTSYNWQLKK